ncbi:MAG TPA: hypothetical protein VEC16_02235 [Alphaproteobacteria bacterium]|nr:hypothetical protein [Alphaproteobacteria bacterium]
MDNMNNLNKENNLIQYCIYLRPKAIDCLTDCISECLTNSNIPNRKPSLDYHVTLFSFYTDSENEKHLQEKLSNGFIPKYQYNRDITFGALDLFENLPSNGRDEKFGALVLRADALGLKNTHRAIVNDMMPYIVLEHGIRADVDKSLFEARYPYVLHNYNAHMTIAKGEFDRKLFSGIVDELQNILDKHNDVYRSDLAVSVKYPGKKWEPANTGFEPSY